MSARVSPIDLHSHTSFSDGAHTPREVVFMAAAAGIEALAVTDHNTADGTPEAKDAGREAGINVIAGTEISVGEAAEWHMLGLGVNAGSAALAAMEAELMIARRERHEIMIDKLRALNIDLRADDISISGVPSRMHIARALVNAGVTKSVEASFNRYLLPGKPAYAPLKRVTSARAIEAVRQAGGVAVLAHPLRYARLDERTMEYILHLKEAGMRGVECRHPSHSPAQAAALERFCRREGLLITGGSDFHGVGEGTLGRLGSEWPSAREDYAEIVAELVSARRKQHIDILEESVE